MNNIPEIHFKAEQDEDGQLTGTLTITFGDTKSVFHGPFAEDGVTVAANHDVERMPNDHYELGDLGAVARVGGSHFAINLDFLRLETGWPVMRHAMIDTPVNET